MFVDPYGNTTKHIYHFVDVIPISGEKEVNK